MKRHALISASSLIFIWPALAQADVTFDGTMNGATAPNGLTLGGANVTVHADYGKQVGSNLFHSFSQFGVNTNQTVEFANSKTTGGTASGINNVIGRVTGGSASTSTPSS